jgi:hypothetical protein
LAALLHSMEQTVFEGAEVVCRIAVATATGTVACPAASAWSLGDEKSDWY